MTPALWISIVGLAITAAGWAITYGALQQKVKDLDGRYREVNDRVTKCEDRHGETSGRIAAMEVDMAVLKERSGTTISALDRIEAKLEAKVRVTRRAPS